MKRFKAYLKRIINLINVREMTVLPGHLAFNIVMMIVPIFSIVGLIGSNFGTARLINALSGNIPDAVLSIISSAINSNTSGYNVFFFIIFGLWLVSGGCRAIIRASDLIYKVQERSNLKEYIKSFLMVIILFLLISFIIIGPVLGDIIIKFLNNYFTEQGINIITTIYHILKYPIFIILMFIIINLLYTMAPSIKISSKYMNKGAWFTTISWFTLSRVYSYHLNNYNTYNIYYGSLSNILILLVWVYLLAYLFTIGLTLNADNYFIMTKEEALKK